jgi:hypothetical protein
MTASARREEVVSPSIAGWGGRALTIAGLVLAHEGGMAW